MIKQGEYDGSSPELPRRGDWLAYIGHRVRAYYGCGMLAAEGEVVGVCTVPTIIVRADDGTLHHHASSLPIEFQQRVQP